MGPRCLLLAVLLAIEYRNAASTARLSLANNNCWLVDSDTTLFFALGQTLACLALAGFQAAARRASQLRGQVPVRNQSANHCWKTTRKQGSQTQGKCSKSSPRVMRRVSGQFANDWQCLCCLLWAKRYQHHLQRLVFVFPSRQSPLLSGRDRPTVLLQSHPRAGGNLRGNATCTSRCR